MNYLIMKLFFLLLGYVTSTSDPTTKYGHCESTTWPVSSTEIKTIGIKFITALVDSAQIDYINS